MSSTGLVTMNMKPTRLPWRVAVVGMVSAVLALTGCGGGDSGAGASSSSASSATSSGSSSASSSSASSSSSSASSGSSGGFTLGGTVSGLSATGLVLASNGVTVTVAANASSFVFGSAFAAGTNYAVSVSVQPAGENCVVSNGSGTLAGNVGNVAVACTLNSYSLGGTISGLSGSGLKLANGADTVSPAAGAATFTMPGQVAYQAAYTVTVTAQPTGQTCSVAGGSGTMPAANVSSVAVSCTTNSYTLGGSITGLSASGLVLANNGVTLTVAANASSFVFPASIPFGTAYAVTVNTQPAGVSCTVTSGAGTMPAANVTTVAVSCAARVWQLKGGNGNTYVGGTYGASAPSTGTPGSRYFTTAWSDNAGKFYLFGGAGVDASAVIGPLNDLWRYDTSNNTWTWLNGSKSSGDALSSGGGGSYGTKGVPSSSNVPGRRRATQQWKDASGNLYVFGGNVIPCDDYNYYNDMWEYIVSTGQWVWLGGSNVLGTVGGQCPQGPTGPLGSGQIVGDPAVYGTRGVESSSNWPGGRSYGVSWTDNAGNFWMFGGVGNDSSGNPQQLNDLWKFNVSTRNWTWVSGTAAAPASLPNYGTKNVPAATNVPGPRQKGQGWADGNGNLYLFGGYGPNALGPNANGSGYGPMNDLWKFNIASGLWTWIGGSNTGDTAGHFGTQGQPAASNMPGARNDAGTWVDASGNFWLFGGYACDATNNWNQMNDLWVYQPSTGQWTWVNGSNSASAPASYVSNPTPGGRDAPATFLDGSGSFWLFGGNGFGNSSGLVSDLWKY